MVVVVVVVDFLRVFGVVNLALPREGSIFLFAESFIFLVYIHIPFRFPRP